MHVRTRPTVLLTDEWAQRAAAIVMACCHPFMYRQVRVQLPARARCELGCLDAPLCISGLSAVATSLVVLGCLLGGDPSFAKYFPKFALSVKSRLM